VPNWFETPLGIARLNELAAADKNQQDTAPRRTRMAKFGTRIYESARNTRRNSGWTTTPSTADSELSTSLTQLRARSRQLIRDSSYAKRARLIVVNNVIGNGINLQAQVKTTRDSLAQSVNDAIEDAWCEWSEKANCHTGGRLSFSNFERALMGQVFEAGEVFVRKHLQPFGRSNIPFALELIEAERLVDDRVVGTINPQTGNEIRMGVEIDSFFRPVAYFLYKRPPGDLRFGFLGVGNDLVERIPADQIEHLAVIDRWPQTRGEPWLHAAATRLNDVDGYASIEMSRAKGQATRLGVIESPEGSSSFADEQEDGTFEMDYEEGSITRLNPGEQFKDLAPTSPNPQFDPFMRIMIRDIAAGSGPSYETKSRD
jgi:lambda family phage portal protein